MNSKTTAFMIFIMGAAVGSILTWQYAKKRYECLTDVEVEVDWPDDESDDIQSKANHAKAKPNISEYAARLREEGYVNYSNPSPTPATEKENKTVSKQEKPRVISPEDFGEIEDYEKISLTYYYPDRVLANENDEKVEDVENVVGLDSLSRFGEYEDDSVFVRNNRLKCDFEILLDQRRYSDVIHRKPQEMNE